MASNCSLPLCSPMSRTRTSLDDVRSLADTMLHASLGKSCSKGLSTTEAELRILQLKYDVTRAVAPPRSDGLFKAACSTDLLFLMDTTGSMQSYIEAAKGQVKSIINEIKMTFFNEASLRIAVVGYKDHGESSNIQFLDFTPEADQVLSFLNQLHATGGADAPEDVLGGIRQSLNAEWKHPTRCIIHIADAPPHGCTLHDLGRGSDTYAKPGSEPHHLTYEILLKQMIELNINYTLLRINNTTDRMAFTFFQEYALASSHCKLNSPTDTTAKNAANLSGPTVTLVGVLSPDAALNLCCNLRS
ncbi:hypothetical protein TGAM01_v210922 [Trichoderma gamsii]|uniref:VWFA domain-containing protein n=1 Tax=Trichoderma gamsii TaxID=398673 RepID=A0A2P4Z7D4_9HYPO|nr:hypothetical protein TGAM01_v210922 [Trichoderma gamsii]PON20201.1 hypothetical protein TGAM01_v210922 [Trichoderma gamsii]